MRALFLALTLSLAPSFVSDAIAQDDVPTSPTMLEKLRAMEPKLLAHLAEHAPDKHAQLMRLQRLDRRAYYKALARVAHAAQEMREDPEMIALRDRLEDLRARHPDGADDLPKAEQKAVRAELQTIAEQLFDLKQAKRREKIAHLREALEHLEAEVAERDKDRKARIEGFVERAMQGPIDL